MIYFDNAANEFAKDIVLDAFVRIEKEYPSNPSSIHHLGHGALRLIEKSKASILSNLKLSDKDYEVIFTSGATEANNLAIKGYALKNKNRGKHIITSKIEHPSVLNVFKSLEEEFGFEVTYLSCKDGTVDLKELESSIRNDTIIVSVMAVNNEIGSLNDISSISKIVSKYPKCVFISDVTQAIGKIELNYNHIDMFSMSSHKIGGLKGSGFLIKRKKINLLTLFDGGGQENGYRSGTIATSLCYSTAVALKDAISNLKNNYEHFINLRNHLLSYLKDNDEIQLNIPSNYVPYIINFSLKTKKASVLVEALSKENIYVSSLSACSSKHEVKSYVIDELYNDEHLSKNTIRISFNRQNSIDEIDEFILKMNKILKELRA